LCCLVQVLSDVVCPIELPEVQCYNDEKSIPTRTHAGWQLGREGGKGGGRIGRRVGKKNKGTKVEKEKGRKERRKKGGGRRKMEEER
jgi:hypothetical protein